jgi:hypothetical protein
LSGASRNDNQGGANYEARHGPNENKMSDRRWHRALPRLEPF